MLLVNYYSESHGKGWISLPRTLCLSSATMEGLHMDSWIRDIKGDYTAAMLFHLCQLRVAVNRQRAAMTESDDSLHWIFFEGLIRLPGAEQLWSSAAPLHQKFFGWLAMLNRCWSADHLHDRGLPHQPMCTLCLQEPETMNHLLMQCPFSRTVWSLLTVPLNIAIPCPRQNSVLVPWWEEAVANSSRANRREANAIINLVMFSLWKERNRRTFDNISVLDSAVANKILAKWRL